MKFTSSLLATVALAGMMTVWDAPLKAINPSLVQASAQEVKQMQKAEMKDTTGLTTKQKIDMLMKNKGQFGSGDQLRRFFFGDLEPISVQPGGAGMVVNLYNKANNVTIAYCATYDVVVNMKQGKVTRFQPSEVK
ncbi:hypothetical protein H6G54_10785 [Anabaena cylindrica FACHB-243]|uniref:Uncharacterized protein n=1 Tax=Anabaena cylindrica (strain ATCC 27899 / PCC 7122) TaxID=272123 RepID=K9ZAZ0_ANACC|nr:MULTISPECIES: hypothetical protein [Anabaena]AFZ56368.1 hypothetical protein Anacy_0785 [Anabaena cylindrica PCC 7122]MBD2418183.1 hypothetical protein [Anabaena cylindrica FACHB-243]MBY5283820.1 hypothetical protein [Anabaena sp. CCAP 1446/1C]MBY5309299.1 hypothetical protein [Anabaena sp. CCAP 1446/1C]MCM2409095.1 hypothetical protein [Anabaena sp. CCAP 1446/1C]